jgi:hypothetical protein
MKLNMTIDDIKLIPKNIGNQNAKKESPKLSYIHMRVKQSDKELIVRNLKQYESLSEFMLGLALAEVNIRQYR